MKISANAPGYKEASADYFKCSAKADEERKDSYAKTRFDWAKDLDQIAGGWEVLSIDTKGTYVAFASRRHATRVGDVATVWFRWEYRESQKSNTGSWYKSVVIRSKYDCSRILMKSVAGSWYSENKLQGENSSSTFEDAVTAWQPAIPGSMGEELLEWACAATARTKPR